MATVERGNVVLTIPDRDIQHYIDKGFSLLDEQGHIVKQAVPKDLNVLQKAFIDNRKEIERLNARIAELESKKTEPVQLETETSKKRSKKKVEE